MKKMLITGGTGFLGSHIIEHFVALDYHISILHRNKSDFSRIQAYLPKVQRINMEEVSLQSVFESNIFDTIIHAATHYGRSGTPSDVLKANVLLPLQLLELGIEYGAKKFINIDSFSSKIVGYEYLPAYHISKRQFLDWSAMLVKQSNASIDFTTLRLEHLYGPRDQESKFIPFVIGKVLDKSESIDLTAGLQKRDFVYVKDVVDAIEVIDNNDISGITEFEVGSGVSYSIREMVELIGELSLPHSTTFQFGVLPTRENELMYSQANINSLQALGWKPRTSLQSGLAATLDYFLKQKETI